MPNRERFLQAVEANRRIRVNPATHIAQYLRRANGHGTWVIVSDVFQLDGFAVQGIQHTETGAVRALYKEPASGNVRFFE
jgi:hypothetical protein